VSKSGDLPSALGAGFNASDIIAGLPAPNGPGGYYIGADGGVAAVGGAPFYGSYPGLPPSARQGSRNFVGAYFDPAGGYTLVSNHGENFHFGP
jgi:hypothetical protein